MARRRRSRRKKTAKPEDADILKGNLCLVEGDFGGAARWYENGLRSAAHSEGEASNLLRRDEDRTRYAFQAACASALAGERELGIETLEAAIELAGYRQGGF